MNVVVSNVFPDDNRGGAAITVATLEAVRAARPDARLTLISTRASPTGSDAALRHTRAAFPDAAVVAAPFDPRGRLATARALLRSVIALLLPRWVQGSPALLAIRAADLVVSKGGHVFIERGGRSGELGLWFTAFPLLYASRLGIPTVAFATSIGPFRTRGSRALNRAILGRLTLVLARDPRSAEAARALLGRTRVAEVPDSVLSMPRPTDAEVAVTCRRFGLDGRRFGAFTVRTKGDRAARDRLLDALAATARELLRRRVVDQLVVVVQVNGPHSSDLRDSRRFVDLVEDDRVDLIDDDLTPRELTALYGGARFVVGCRMHSTILAMVAGTPAIGIALSGEKVAGVFEQLGLLDRVTEQAEVSSTALLQQLHELVDENVRHRRWTERAIDLARQDAEHAVEELRAIVDLSVRGRADEPFAHHGAHAIHRGEAP